MNKQEFALFENILMHEGGFGSFYDFKACLEQAFLQLNPQIDKRIFQVSVLKQLDYLFKLIAKMKET
jgi:hypothetical protein